MVNKYLNVLLAEIFKTIQNPLRVRNLFDRTKLLPWIWSYRTEEKTDWQEFNRDGFKNRNYNTYTEYQNHQRSKLERFLLNWDKSWLKRYDIYYRNQLRERLKPHIQESGLNVLCLAARLGTEVKSFIDLGCFAVGIDLNPGKENKYVVVGDFHDLQYADSSVDIVFTNSFDHVFYLDKILSEIQRVLKLKGQFFTELAFGVDEGVNPGDYETLSWSKLDDLIHKIEEYSFKIVYREKYSDSREFLIFQKEALPESESVNSSIAQTQP